MLSFETCHLETCARPRYCNARPTRQCTAETTPTGDAHASCTPRPMHPLAASPIERHTDLLKRVRLDDLFRGRVNDYQLFRREPNQGLFGLFPAVTTLPKGRAKRGRPSADLCEPKLGLRCLGPRQRLPLGHQQLLPHFLRTPQCNPVHEHVSPAVRLCSSRRSACRSRRNCSSN